VEHRFANVSKKQVLAGYNTTQLHQSLIYQPLISGISTNKIL
jgi:hypothetical protein